MMKKLALLLAVVLVLSAPLTVHAATRALSIYPDLAFNGTTATCDATVLGDTDSEYIVVTMKLWHGTNCIASWTDSGYGFVLMNEKCTVTKGQTYKLTVDVTINGVSKTPVSVSETC